MNSPQEVISAKPNKQQEPQKQQADKPRRSMRSDTLGSTGSSRASSCDEPIIVTGARSPPNSSANLLCNPTAPTATLTTLTTGVSGSPRNQPGSSDGRNCSGGVGGGGQLKGNPASSCSLESIGWSATDLALSQALCKPQPALSGRLEANGDDDEEQEEEEDQEGEEDEEEEEAECEGDEPTLSMEQRAELSAAEVAARKPPIAPPFESITLKLKSNTTPPDARFVKRHIEDLISQNEAIVYNWNSVSIRSYNSSSSATSASSTTIAAAAVAPTSSPLIPAPLRKTSASAYIGDHKRPASGGSESISGGQPSVSQQLRQRKRWSTTVLGDFQKHQQQYQQQQQQQPIALVATQPCGAKQTSYSNKFCDNDNDNEQQATKKTPTPPLAPAQAPINYRLRQLEQRRSQSHLVPMRKTSEYSLLSVAATENTKLAGHHRLSHGSSLLQDRRQQQQQVDTFHHRASQDPVQLENGIQNLSLKRKDNNLLSQHHACQDEPQKFETTSGANLLLLHQQQLQLQHQYNLLNNATNQAHITTTNTSNDTPMMGHHHFNLDQILNQHHQQQQQQPDHHHHHHHCNEQMLLKFLMEKNLLEHQMNLGNQAAAMLYLQQQQHHHDNPDQHQRQMIEQQQQIEEFRLRQLAAAAAAVAVSQAGSSLEPSMPPASHIVGSQFNDIMDRHQMAMIRGNSASSVPSLLSSLGDTHNNQYHHLIQHQQPTMALNATGCQQQQQQQQQQSQPPPIQQLTTVGCSSQVAAAAVVGSQELRNQPIQASSGCLPFKKRKISEPIMRYE